MCHHLVKNKKKIALTSFEAVLNKLSDAFNRLAIYINFINLIWNVSLIFFGLSVFTNISLFGMVHFWNFCNETAVVNDAKVKNDSLPGSSLTPFWFVKADKHFCGDFAVVSLSEEDKGKKYIQVTMMI